MAKNPSTFAFDMVCQMGNQKAADPLGKFFHSEKWIDPHYCVVAKLKKDAEDYWEVSVAICLDIEDGRYLEQCSARVGFNDVNWKRAKEVIIDTVSQYCRY